MPVASRAVRAAGALRLHESEHAHLFHLAGEVPEAPARPSADVPAGVLRLLGRLPGTPVFVIDAKHEVLACNRLAATLLGESAQGSPDRRNVVWNLFLGAHSGEVLADPQASVFADKCVAQLRAAAARFPHDPG